MASARWSAASCVKRWLRHGQLAVVQALLVGELPLAVLIVPAAGGRRPTARQWWAVLAVVAGLATVLLAATPSAVPVASTPATGVWIVVAVATAGVVAVLAALARLRPGAWRAALLATAAGCGFALTAALVKVTVPAVARPDQPAGLLVDVRDGGERAG